MTEISDFLSYVKKSGGYYRPNKYSVEITPPIDLPIDNASLQRICVNCTAAQIPGKSLETKDHSAGGGHVREHAHSVQSGRTNLRFNVSEDLLEQRFFGAWINLTHDPVFANLNYYEKYVGLLCVEPISRFPGRKLGVYTYFEAYPLIMNAIEVDNEENDTIAQLDVTFAYHSTTYRKGK